MRCSGSEDPRLAWRALHDMSQGMSSSPSGKGKRQVHAERMKAVSVRTFYSHASYRICSQHDFVTPYSRWSMDGRVSRFQRSRIYFIDGK